MKENNGNFMNIFNQSIPENNNHQQTNSAEHINKFAQQQVEQPQIQPEPFNPFGAPVQNEMPQMEQPQVQPEPFSPFGAPVQNEIPQMEQPQVQPESFSPFGAPVQNEMPQMEQPQVQPEPFSPFGAPVQNEIPQMEQPQVQPESFSLFGAPVQNEIPQMNQQKQVQPTPFNPLGFNGDNTAKSNEFNETSANKKRISPMIIVIIAIVIFGIIIIIPKILRFVSIKKSYDEAKLDIYINSVYGYLSTIDKAITLSSMENPLQEYNVSVPYGNTCDIANLSSACSPFYQLVNSKTIGNKPIAGKITINHDKTIVIIDLSYDGKTKYEYDGIEVKVQK